MARRSDRQLKRMGALCIVVLLVAMAAAFNLQKFPGFRGTHYHAQFKDASGLKVGDVVEIAGIRVGRVDNLSIAGDHIGVDFDIHGTKLGKDTEASIEVLNLLGQKYLRLIPAGDGAMASGATIPLARTISGYDIVSTLDQLTDTTGAIDKPQLGKALTALASTLDAAGPEVSSSFRGLARLSNTIASRDDEITALMARAQRVTNLLNSRKGDLVGLMKNGSLVFGELLARRQAIHDVLVNARQLGVQLRGLAVDNQAQIGPALAELDKAVTFLNKRKQQLSDTIKYYGPYATILVNIIGTGPWFDAYVPNLAGLGTGEFRPGKRTYPK